MKIDHLLAEQVHDDCKVVDNVQDILRVITNKNTTTVSLQGVVVFRAISHLSSPLSIESFRPGLWIEKLHDAANVVRDQRKRKLELKFAPIDDKEIWND
ncbi:MAG: hypothetical protein PHU12_04140 [Candidatus Aenigmarchaeota archaeon]|jgi:hypothetical protein|nr:hypothetical protein [Candidatus Aenigmarchaeota archaeon]